jgi:hypothetical protein
MLAPIVSGFVMKLRVVSVAALYAAIFVGSGAEAGGPFGSINVGNWKGGAYTDQNGAFTHCSGGSQYASGIYFMVMIDKGGDGASLLPTTNGR